MVSFTRSRHDGSLKQTVPEVRDMRSYSDLGSPTTPKLRDPPGRFWALAPVW